MHKLSSLYLIPLIALCLTTPVEAKTVVPSKPVTTVLPTLKPGSWEIFYYQGPNEHTQTNTATICINTDNTWHIIFTGGVVIPGAGGWSVDNNNVTLYGSVGEAILGAAFSAIGNLVGDNLITGHYVHFNVQSNSNYPNGDYGSFKATFLTNTCP